MKNQKRFVVLIVLVIVASVLKFQVKSDRFEEVSTFRGANIQKEVFNPLIAQSVNKEGITANLNGQIYTSADGIYMSDKLSIMVPTRLLMDGFGCAAHIYGTDTVYIRQLENEICLTADKNSMYINGTLYFLEDPMVIKDGVAYIPLQQLQQYLNYMLSWDANTNTAMGTTTLEGTYLPSSFDLRDHERVGYTKDQGSHGTCWAFASLSAIESTLLPQEMTHFSAEHMTLRNSFSTDLDAGGEYTMGMAYLTSWQGPVYESQDPYGDGKSPEGLKAVKHVQEIQILQSKDYTAIKESVYKYGAVQSSIYMNLVAKDRTTAYYNADNNAYYYNGSSIVNHDILIIGWDDSYSRDNFSRKPEKDGAFLCLNSWGENFGDQGAFWVSYEDVNIGTRNISYKTIEGIDNYDSIYQSDLCGWGAQLGYERSEIYAANVFTANSDENVEAAGFYATDVNTSYEIYVVSNFTGTASFKDGVLVASGTKSETGYYTIPFKDAIPVEEGNKFAIIIKITTPSSKLPLAVEYADPEGNVEIDLTDGEGYISSTGTVWERVEDTKNCNICLKAYTTKR